MNLCFKTDVERLVKSFYDIKNNDEELFLMVFESKKTFLKNFYNEEELNQMYIEALKNILK